MTRIAIIGGGPGGLMTARLLEQAFGPSCRVTLFEASHRVGGKIQTRRFEAAPVMYEAGVAECYAYEAIGHDPLRQLVAELGLTTVPTHSSAVVLNGALLRDDREIGDNFGDRHARGRSRSFAGRPAAMLPLASWHRGFVAGRQPASVGAPDVRGHPGGGGGPGREAVSEDRRPQRHGDRAAPHQRAHRAEELPEVRARLRRAVLD